MNISGIDMENFRCYNKGKFLKRRGFMFKKAVPVWIKTEGGKTGTLWEYRDNSGGSPEHGFASYVALTLPFADTVN